MYADILNHLSDLNNSNLDIKGSAVASTDGMILATTLPEQMNEDNVAAISAGALMLGTRTSQECASGSLEQILIKCKENCVVMTQAGKERILTVMIRPHVDLNSTFNQIKHYADKIAALL